MARGKSPIATRLRDAEDLKVPNIVRLKERKPRQWKKGFPMTPTQLEVLLPVFKLDPSPPRKTREDLARQLSM